MAEKWNLKFDEIAKVITFYWSLFYWKTTEYAGDTLISSPFFFSGSSYICTHLFLLSTNKFIGFMEVKILELIGFSEDLIIMHRIPLHKIFYGNYIFYILFGCFPWWGFHNLIRKTIILIRNLFLKVILLSQIVYITLKIFHSSIRYIFINTLFCEKLYRNKTHPEAL